MWRNWLPHVNQVEDSDDSYNSPAEEEGEENAFVSPRRPHQSPTASPRALLVPDQPATLEVLESVGRSLRNLPNNPHRQALQARQAAEAAAAVDRVEVPAIMPNVVDFEDENGDNDAGAMQEALRVLLKYEWNPKDLDFYWGQIEIKMAAAGVRKNFTKFQILSSIVPTHVVEEVKSLLRKKESEFPQNNAYKLLKAEITSIFGPKLEESMDRALGRVLVGKPSTLARALVNDICKKELRGCTCCPAVVLSLWKRHLPGNVRAAIASMPFNADTFKEVTQHADAVFASNAPVTVAAVRSEAAVLAQPPASLDETQPGLAYPVAEVAAIRGGRGGRGFNRGGRNNRGGRGGASSGTQQAAGNNSGGQRQTKNKGPRHPDNPPFQGCQMHWKWGKSAFFCSEPSTCPWKNIFSPKPDNK